MSLVREIHGDVAALATVRRLQPIVKHAPAFTRVVGRILDPYDMPAELTHRGGEPVYRGHDGARLRYLALEHRLCEIVRHGDDDESGLRRVDRVEGVRAPRALRHARDEIGGQ